MDLKCPFFCLPCLNHKPPCFSRCSGFSCRFEPSGAVVGKYRRRGNVRFETRRNSFETLTERRIPADNLPGCIERKHRIR